MRRIVCLLIVVMAPLAAQDWAPVHIEAINSYPSLAWLSRSTGNVIVNCLINDDGCVAKATAISGAALFDAAVRPDD
jgi:hypothetical protein